MPLFAMWLGMVALVACGGTGLAAERKLTSGEMYRTAHTPDKGDFVWHPLFLPSQVGVTDDIALSFGTMSAVPGSHKLIELLDLGGDASMSFLPGPSLGAEFAAVQSDKVALSVGPRVQTGWTLDYSLMGVNMRFTTQIEMLRLSAGVGYHQMALYNHVPLYSDDPKADRKADEETIHLGWLPVELILDFVVNERTILRFDTATIPMVGNRGTEMSKAGGRYLAISGFSWHHAVSPLFRTALGGNIIYKNMYVTGWDHHAGLVAFVPNIQFWFKF